MSTIKVFNPAGEPAGEMTFAKERLELEKGEQAVKDVVVAIRNAYRAGTASTLSKGEVAGSNKKPWRQKGTGRARAGYRQSPVWRGGGVAFGPKPRDYSQKINRKVQQLAFTRALSEKIAGGQTMVIDTIDLAEPKTKLLKALLAKLGLDRSVLIVLDQHEEKVMLAARNLQKVEVVSAAEVDVYSLLLYRTLVATKAGFEALTARMRKKTEVSA
ncbi:MAG: 50S ribosomal protein L4 [Kiritimatiellae bacterium]|jgi:large subunit ribosomal protein L4|nr:50S ribosomal protein L4 [Kiritimatiellia bacterium]MDD3583883.1 50S ribosomal protein L4 [Kiritimatiellia bacterium]HHU14527.1 50S ribosomal protein L4 [Lentisphaerota bacterium]